MVMVSTISDYYDYNVKTEINVSILVVPTISQKPSQIPGPGLAWSDMIAAALVVNTLGCCQDPD